MKEKVVEESEVDWGQLKKVTVDGEEEAAVDEAVQLKKVDQEAAEIQQLGPRRQSVLVRQSSTIQYDTIRYDTVVMLSSVASDMVFSYKTLHLLRNLLFVDMFGILSLLMLFILQAVY